MRYSSDFKSSLNLGTAFTNQAGAVFNARVKQFGANGAGEVFENHGTLNLDGTNDLVFAQAIYGF